MPQQLPNQTQERKSPLNGPYARNRANKKARPRSDEVKRPRRLELWADQTDDRSHNSALNPQQTNRPDSDTARGEIRGGIRAQETESAQTRKHGARLSQTHKGAQKDIAGGRWKAPSFPLHPKGQDFEDHFAVDLDLKVSMILPQVHLRKPCYDFSFL